MKKQLIGIGTSAICYRTNNEVYKIYHDKSFKTKSRRDFIEKLIKFDNNSFIFPNKIISVNSILDGYTYDYVTGKRFKDIDGNILDTLDDFSSLVKSIEDISKNDIVINDLTDKNIIYDDTYKIIDLDRYCIMKTSNTYERNLKYVTEVLIRSLLNVKPGYSYRFKSKALNEIYKDIQNNPDRYYDLVNCIVKEENSKDIKTLRKKDIYTSWEDDYYFKRYL